MAVQLGLEDAFHAYDRYFRQFKSHVKELGDLKGMGWKMWRSFLVLPEGFSGRTPALSHEKEVCEGGVKHLDHQKSIFFPIAHVA